MSRPLASRRAKRSSQTIKNNELEDEMGRKKSWDELNEELESSNGMTLVQIRPKRKQAKSIDEDTIRLTAYYIWEASGKSMPAEDCWHAAKKKMGIE